MLRIAGRPALLLCGLLAAGLALQRLGLDAGVAAAGQRGPLAYLAVATSACAVGVPRQVVAYSAGLAFGFWPGSALALLAECLGCIIDFFWARLVARAWAARWLERAEARTTGNSQIQRLNRFLVGNTFTATLTLRLLPVGNNVVLNLMAGVSSVAAGPFVLASVLGYVPQTAVFALLGGGVRVSQSAQIMLAAALFAVSIALGLALLRRRRVIDGDDAV